MRAPALPGLRRILARPDARCATLRRILVGGRSGLSSVRWIRARILFTSATLGGICIARLPGGIRTARRVVGIVADPPSLGEIFGCAVHEECVSLVVVDLRLTTDTGSSRSWSNPETRSPERKAS